MDQDEFGLPKAKRIKLEADENCHGAYEEAHDVVNDELAPNLETTSGHTVEEFPHSSVSNVQVDFTSDDVNNVHFGSAKEVRDHDEIQQLKHFQVLDEYNPENDEDSAREEESEGGSEPEELADNELEQMLEEDLPENFKGAPRPKEKPYTTKQKLLIEEKGSHDLEILPLDWMMVNHCTGIPVFLHKSSRVCTLSRPYFLGTGSVRKHEFPVSAIPCLYYKKSLEDEKLKANKNNLSDNNVVDLDTNIVSAENVSNHNLDVASERNEVESINLDNLEENTNTTTQEQSASEKEFDVSDKLQVSGENNQADENSDKDIENINLDGKYKEKDLKLTPDDEGIEELDNTHLDNLDKSIVHDKKNTPSIKTEAMNVDEADEDNENSVNTECKVIKDSKGNGEVLRKCPFRAIQSPSDKPSETSENPKSFVDQITTEEVNRIKKPSKSQDPISTGKPRTIKEPSNNEDPISIEDPIMIEDPSTIGDTIRTKEPSKNKDPIRAEDPSETTDPNNIEDPIGDRNRTTDTNNEDQIRAEDPSTNEDPNRIEDPSTNVDQSTTNNPSVAAGQVLPIARVQSVQDNWRKQHLTHDQVIEYCKKLFIFKTINIMHFKRWADRRRFAKAKKTMQRPTLPHGTKLITIPAQSATDTQPNSGQGLLAPSRASQREWTMDMSGRSYVSVFHEYVRRVMQKQPVYEFQQTDNASTPYQACVLINGMKYGVGHGTSKRQAKSDAARESILILIPELRENIKQDDKPKFNSDEPDFSFFDMVEIEDPRIMEFCATTMEPSPHAILRTCLLRNFGTGEQQIEYEMKKLKHQRIEFTMRVGKHTATVVCKNKKTGKQRASQAILQKLHPLVKSWGSLLRLYGSRSIKSCKEKKIEEQEITLLQDKATVNQPNYAILDKLMREMRVLEETDGAVVPIGTLIVEDDLPVHSGSNLNNVDV